MNNMKKLNQSTTQQANVQNAPDPTFSSRDRALQEITALYAEMNEAITWSQRRAIQGQIQVIAEANNITL